MRERGQEPPTWEAITARYAETCRNYAETCKKYNRLCRDWERTFKAAVLVGWPLMFLLGILVGATR